MKASEYHLNLFQEQIYYKFVKGSSSKKQIISTTKIFDIIDLIAENGLYNKLHLLYCYIQRKLSQNSRNLHYSEVQSVHLDYKDEKLKRLMGTNKNTFYAAINHLIDHKVLFKVGSYNAYYYIVNPYFIDNMTKAHWNDMVEDIRSSELNRLNEAFGSGGGITPQQIVEPQPAVER